MKESIFLHTRYRATKVIMLSLFMISSILYFSCINPGGNKPSQGNSDLTVSPEFSKKGHLKFVAPNKMQQDVTDEFRAEIVKDSMKNISFFKETASSEYKVNIDSIDIGEIMSIELMEKIEKNKLDSNFHIKLINSEIQYLDKDGITSWTWQVTPINSGTHTLILLAKVKIWDERMQKYINKDLPLKRRVIHVEVEEKIEALSTTAEEIKQSNNYYYWLLALPIIGLIIWFALRQKKVYQSKLIPFAEAEEFKSTFLQLIANDDIDKSFTCIEKILKKYKDKDLKKELVMLKSNYKNNISRYNRNLIDNDEFGMNRSKVINGLIALSDQLKSEES